MTTVAVKLPNDAANTGPQMHTEQQATGIGLLLEQVVQISSATDISTGTLQAAGNTILAAIQTLLSSPPSGSATAALQTAGNTILAALQTLQTAGNASLASVDGKTPALVGGAVPVSNATGATAALQTAGNTILSALQTLLTTISTTTATSALQGTGNTSLASIDSKTPALQGGAVPVVTASQVTAQTDRSGTITTGGTAQVLMAANATRKGWWIQNNSSATLWVNDVGTATAGGSSIPVAGVPTGGTVGSLYESPSRTSPNAISIFGATTGQAFAAREY